MKRLVRNGFVSTSGKPYFFMKVVGQREEIVSGVAIPSAHRLRRQRAVGAVGMRMQVAAEEAARPLEDVETHSEDPYPPLCHCRIESSGQSSMMMLSVRLSRTK